MRQASAAACQGSFSTTLSRLGDTNQAQGVTAMLRAELRASACSCALSSVFSPLDLVNLAQHRQGY
jgi:hypothetical protein